MAGVLIEEFDVYRAGYQGASVEVRVAGTTQKASIYYDVDLTEPATNPQILESYQDGGGTTYGKFSQPVYCGVSYELLINGSDQSGVHKPPLLAVAGEDASNMVAKPRASGRLRTLQDLASNQIFAEDYGEIGNSAATNTTTLETAIGQAAAVGGGDVILPARTFAFNQITLSAGVRLVGSGRDATIMQSQVADKAITLSGEGCGLANLTVDGINLTAGSYGVYGVNMTRTRLDGVTVKRFNRGIEARGGTNNLWRDLTVENCVYGARLLGDTDAGNGAGGAEWFRNAWSGGTVETCTTAGIYMSYEDTTVVQNLIEKVKFDTNTGIGLHLNGARYTHVADCGFVGNTGDMKIEDDNLASSADMAKVVYARTEKTKFDGGTITIEDTAEDIIFEGCNFENVTFTLTLPNNNIALINCDTDADTTFSGDTTKINYFYDADEGTVAGRTTDGTATKAWSTGTLDPGEVVFIEAIAIGNSRNSAARGVYRRMGKYVRAGSVLSFDNQTSNFTLGQTVTGGTSGATGLIMAQTDAGTTGTLTLRELTGTFQDNETITDGGGGSAQVNGVIAPGTVSILGSVEALGTDYEDVVGWNFTLTAASTEVEATVTGAASTTIDWTVYVKSIYG